MSDEVLLGTKVSLLMQYLGLLDKPIGLDALRVIFPKEGWDEVLVVIEQAQKDGVLVVDTVHTGKGSHVLISVKDGGV